LEPNNGEKINYWAYDIRLKNIFFKYNRYLMVLENRVTTIQ